MLYYEVHLTFPKVEEIVLETTVTISIKLHSLFTITVATVFISMYIFAMKVKLIK